jgi:hypothetical protein
MARWYLGLFACVAVTGSALHSQAGPTYAEDIRPILATNCVPCHHTNGQGPFPLQTFDQVRKRADLVRQVVLTGQMPPTDAMTDFGRLSPHRSLTPAELIVVQEWFRLGLPKGRPLPKIPDPTPIAAGIYQGRIAFQVGTGQRIPQEGRTTRTVYKVDLPTTAGRSWSRIAFQPDSPKAVRQVILAVQRKGQKVPFTSAGVVPNTTVAAWSDGFFAWRSNGSPLRLEPKDSIWIQVRAVPTGKPERASGILILDPSRAGEPAMAKSMGNRTFQIAADTQAVLRDEWTIDRDIDLVSVLPEARFTTEQVKLSVREGDKVRSILVVLTWDPVWPGAYNFLEPIRLKRGSTLVYEAVINNSRHGHAAEDDVPKPVRFGPTASDELFWCHIYYIPRP